MAKLYNLARMSTATTGTGVITLGSAVPPMLTFAQAGVQDGESVTYSIIDGTSNSEIGRGVYTSAGTTLSRSVLRSTNSNNPIDLSGAAHVLITAAAEDIITPGASQGQAEAGTDNSTVMTPLRVAQSVVTISQPFKNLVGRNGGMEVWQRGTSVAVAASTAAYTVDGWYLATGANQAATVSQQGGLVTGSQRSARVQRNSGQTGTGTMRFAMPLDLDEVGRFSGKTVIMSFTVSTGSNWSPTNGTLTWALYCGTGGTAAKRNATAYGGEANPIGGSVNLAQGVAAARQLSTIAAISSSTLQAELQFSWTPQGSAGANDWFQIDDVQVEVVPAGISAVSPVFERASHQFDLFRCQRYAHYFGNVQTIASFTSYLIPPGLISPPMRLTPTGSINVNGSTTVTKSDGSGSHTFSTLTLGVLDNENWTNCTFTGLGGLGSSFTVGHMYYMTNLLLSAEI